MFGGENKASKVGEINLAQRASSLKVKKHKLSEKNSSKDRHDHIISAKALCNQKSDKGILCRIIMQVVGTEFVKVDKNNRKT